VRHFLQQRHAFGPRPRAPGGIRGLRGGDGLARLLAAGALERAEQQARVDGAAIVELARGKDIASVDDEWIASAEGLFDAFNRRIELAMEILHLIAADGGVRDFLHGLRSSLLKRFVEKADERGGPAEYIQNARVELRLRGERGRKFPARDELAVLQVLGGLVIFRKTTRHAGHPLALESAVERPLESRRLDDRSELVEVPGEVLAHLVKLRHLRVIHAAADPDAIGRDVKVQPGAAALAERAMPEARGDVRLVRLLVLRKPDVAVDAVHALRPDEQLRRDAAHVDRQPIDDREHRLTDDAFVLVLARVEPLAPVVALQPRQERERVLAESRGRHQITRRLNSPSPPPASAPSAPAARA